MKINKYFVKRKSLYLFSLLFLFLFFSSFSSAELINGDSACMDSENWCSSIFIIGDYFYCDIDDVIVCENGCDDNLCIDFEEPECSSGYEKCDGQTKYDCINNSWSFVEVCSYSCVNPTVTYSYCDVLDEEIEVIENYTFEEEVLDYWIGENVNSGSAGVMINFHTDSFFSLKNNYIGNITSYSSWIYDFSYYTSPACTDFNLLIFDNDSIGSPPLYNFSVDSFDGYGFPGLYSKLDFYFDEIYLDGDSYFVVVGDSSSCFVPMVLDYCGASYDTNYKYNITSESFSSGDHYYSVSYILGVSNFSINSFSNVEMVTDSFSQLNLSSEYSDWYSISIYLSDPINGYPLEITDGYSTLFSDYFDISLSSDILSFTSYSRPYNYSLLVTYCFDSLELSCVTLPLNVSISGNLSSVVQLKPLPTYVNLGFIDSTTFSGNYFFQYYDEIIFSCPDSNYTGILNSSFPFNYHTLSNPVNNASFMIDFNCTIDQDEINYNFLGDINYTLSCGDLQSYFTMAHYNNYNQTCFVNASNSNSQISDYFILYGGNPSYLTGEYPDYSYLDESNSSAFTDTADGFFSVFSEVVSSSAKNKIAFAIIIALIVSVWTWGFLFTRSIVFSVWITIFALIVWLFFLARVEMVSYMFPITLSFVVGIFLFFKMVGVSNV